MKYLEELDIGDTFVYKEYIFFVTSDFKSDGKRLCYNLSNGFPNWFDTNISVSIEPIYILDKDNNISPVKIKHEQNTNVS